MSAILYVPVGTSVTVIEGDPPVDQSAEVATLQDQVATLTAERDQAVDALGPLTTERDQAVVALEAMTAERDALAVKITAARIEAEQSVTEAQQVKDSLA